MERGSDGEARLPASSRGDAEAMALVLAAEGIPHRVVNESGRFSVGLASADHARAELVLAAWARENAPEAPPPAPDPGVDTRAGIWLAAALVAAYFVTGGWDDASEWFERGANDGRLVVAGEWWRPVTALTLHGDVSHVLGNAFSCAVFGSLLMSRYGAGAGGLLLLASGALGNWLAAEWYRWHYVSVGASTALFGAIGALTSAELVRRRRLQLRWGQSWLPLAGGLGLLAMLGTGKGSDFLAHVFGLLSGMALGVPAALGFRRPPPARAQLALAALALAVLAAAWRAALAA